MDLAVGLSVFGIKILTSESACLVSSSLSEEHAIQPEEINSPSLDSTARTGSPFAELAESFSSSGMSCMPSENAGAICDGLDCGKC